MLRLLARCAGLYNVDTKTMQPSRSLVVHAAAYVIASTCAYAAIRETDSCVQAL